MLISIQMTFFPLPCGEGQRIIITFSEGILVIFTLVFEGWLILQGIMYINAKLEEIGGKTLEKLISVSI